MLLLIGILICIGALIDESQDNNYIQNRACAQSRQILLLIWLVFGFFISMSYKSVLLANMVSNKYAGAINTMEDILQSGLPYYVAADGVSLLNKDPRASVKQLVERQLIFFNLTLQGTPKYVQNGYV